jgi:hypothetical protein
MSLETETEIEGKETWDRSLEDQMWIWEKTRPLTLKRALRQIKRIRKYPLRPLERDTEPVASFRKIALKNRSETIAERDLHFVVLAYRTIVDEKETENNRWIFGLVRSYYGVPEGQPIPSEVKRKLKSAYKYALKRIQELELRKIKTGQSLGHYHNLNDFERHSALIEKVKAKARRD